MPTASTASAASCRGRARCELGVQCRLSARPEREVMPREERGQHPDVSRSTPFGGGRPRKRQQAASCKLTPKHSPTHDHDELAGSAAPRPAAVQGARPSAGSVLVSLPDSERGQLAAHRIELTAASATSSRPPRRSSSSALSPARRSPSGRRSGAGAGCSTGVRVGPRAGGRRGRKRHLG